MAIHTKREKEFIINVKDQKYNNSTSGERH